jgi:hypothetical protein
MRLPTQFLTIKEWLKNQLGVFFTKKFIFQFILT